MRLTRLVLLAVVVAGIAIAVSRRKNLGRGFAPALTQEAGAHEPTRDELYARAKVLDIQGRSKMTKDELRRAITRAEEGHDG